jgi:hypothetical protein
MAGADGILGAAGITGKSLVIDFQRNRVTICHGVEAGVRANSMKFHAVRLAGGLMTLETRIGGVAVRAVIDTGAERTLGNLALRNALRARRTRGVLATMTSVYGATQDVESGEIQIVPPIVIDSLRITDVRMVFGNFHIFKVWGMQDQPAIIIGMDVLGTVASLSIDFKSQDVYVGSVRPKTDMFSIMRGVTAETTQKR